MIFIYSYVEVWLLPVDYMSNSQLYQLAIFPELYSNVGFQCQLPSHPAIITILITGTNRTSCLSCRSMQELSILFHFHDICFSFHEFIHEELLNILGSSENRILFFQYFFSTIYYKCIYSCFQDLIKSMSLTWCYAMKFSLFLRWINFFLFCFALVKKISYSPSFLCAQIWHRYKGSSKRFRAISEIQI